MTAGLSSIRATRCASPGPRRKPGWRLSIGEDHARASRNFATKCVNAPRFALINGASPAPLPSRGTDRRPTMDPRRWKSSRRGDSTLDSYSSAGL